MAQRPLLPPHYSSAPASERFHHSSHGCIVLRHMWRYGLQTQSRETCWPMPASSSGRHSVTGEMAGRNTTGPSAARPPLTPPYPGTRYCRAYKPPLLWGQGRVQGYFARYVGNPTILPPNVPWPRSSNKSCQHPIPSFTTTDLRYRPTIHRLFVGPSGRHVAQRRRSPSAGHGTGAPAPSPDRAHTDTFAATAN